MRESLAKCHTGGSGWLGNTARRVGGRAVMLCSIARRYY